MRSSADRQQRGYKSPRNGEIRRHLRLFYTPVCLTLWYSVATASALSISDLSCLVGGSVAEWLACWTQVQKGPGSNRSRDAVG